MKFKVLIAVLGLMIFQSCAPVYLRSVIGYEKKGEYAQAMYECAIAYVSAVMEKDEFDEKMSEYKEELGDDYCKTLRDAYSLAVIATGEKTQMALNSLGDQRKKYSLKARYAADVGMMYHRMYKECLSQKESE